MQFNIMQCAVVSGLFTSGTLADIYRVTVSGEVESVTDTRTSENDVFNGTAWDVDDFSVSVGDAWSYEVIYDTDVSPGAFNDQGDSQFSIYDAQFASTVSLNGQSISGFESVTNFIDGDVEIFAGLQLNVNVFMFFARLDGLNDLINGGALPSDPAFFDDLGLSFFQVSDQDRFEVEGASDFSVTVEQIPAPGSLGVVGICGLLAARRRR